MILRKLHAADKRIHLCGMQEMKRRHRREGWLFVPLYFYKLIAGAFDAKESKLRTLYRIVLLVVFPGLNDHWPSDYENKLRKALIRESHMIGGDKHSGGTKGRQESSVERSPSG